MEIMVISKAWLDEKLNEVESELQTEMSESRLAILMGKKEAFQLCYNELTKSPLPKDVKDHIEKLKEFDPDKIYEEIVRFYIDKKGYTKEHANEIAQKIVQDQKQKRL